MSSLGEAEKFGAEELAEAVKHRPGKRDIVVTPEDGLSLHSNLKDPDGLSLHSSKIYRPASVRGGSPPRVWGTFKFKLGSQ